MIAWRLPVKPDARVRPFTPLMVRAVVLAYGRVDAVELVAMMYEARRLLVKTPDPETERAV